MPNAPNVVDFWLWPLTWSGLLGRDDPVPPEIPFFSHNEIVADLANLRLRRFAFAALGPAPVLVVAPFAVHDAGIADLAEGHSLVAALAGYGLGPIYLVEWKSARRDMAGASIDGCLADLNAAMDLAGSDQAGERPDLVGLCQGGWMSLVHAAAFPGKARRLVIVGAPVDTSFASPIAEGARLTPELVIDQAIAAEGGIVSGAATLAAFRASGGAERDAPEILQIAGPDADPAACSALADWDARTLDLPGVYYRQVAAWLFRENRLAQGTFPAFGRPTPLSRVAAPMFVLAGLADRIAPPAQVRAALDLVGTPPAERNCLEADCGHLGLFMGARTLRQEWREIADWLLRP